MCEWIVGFMLKYGESDYWIQTTGKFWLEYVILFMSFKS